MMTVGTITQLTTDKGPLPTQLTARPPVRSEPMLAACDIIRRLVDKVNVDNEYDEHNCPNGEPCGVCKLVAEAKAFIAANNGMDGKAVRE